MPPDPFHDDYFGTFCIYCQKDYGTERKLFTHVKRNHQDTYASHTVKEIEERRKSSSQ